MKAFFFLGISLLFSIDSFAYLKDFPTIEAQKNLETKTAARQQNLDFMLTIMNNSAELGRLDYVSSVAIYEKTEYLKWKHYCLMEISRALDFISQVSNKPISSDDQQFLIQAEFMLKMYQQYISKDYMNFAKTKYNDHSTVMQNIWPGHFIDINVEYLLALNERDDRAGMLFLFHELVHDYYYGPTKPKSGIDLTSNNGDCFYQENIAWEATIRLVNLANAYDRPIDSSILNTELYNSFNNQKKWKDSIIKYCMVKI